MNEYYYELTINIEEEIEIFSSFLLEVTQNAIEEKSGQLIIRSTHSLEEIEWATKQLASKLNIKIETLLEKRKNEDWISKYKNSIKPIEVGSFYIRPQWKEAKENLTNIIINPALAFGSGHHESTFSILKIVDKYIKKDMRVLDVGSGSGILAIASYKKGAVVDICDTDEIAVKSSIDNFKQNSSTLNAYWIGSANSAKKSYDVVIANIIADVIILINKDLKLCVKSGGILILSGIIENSFDKVCKKFSDFEKIESIKMNEWHTLVLRKV